MNSYQKALVEEHFNLVIRIQNLHNYVYSSKSNNDDRVEFANKCIQLAAMKKYEEALCARLSNAGITFENGNYFERVTPVITTVMPNAGSDYDVDGETQQPNNSENNEQ